VCVVCTCVCVYVHVCMCVIPACAVYPRHDVSTTNSPFSPSKCCVWVPESISSSIVETQIEEHQQQRVNLASSINLTPCKHFGSQCSSWGRSSDLFVQTMASLVAKFPSLLRPAARSPALVGLTQQVRKPKVVRIVWYSRLCMGCCTYINIQSPPPTRPPGSLGLVGLLQIALRGVCDRDQDSWSAKIVLDHSMVPFRSSWLLVFTRVQRTKCCHASLVAEKMCWY